MRKSDQGQAIVIVAIGLWVSVILLALVVDTGRISVEKSKLNRTAEGATLAGANMASDLMVTRAAMRQATAMAQPTPAPPITPTATPPLRDTLAWLTAEDITWLTSSPAARTPVAATALDYANRNGFGSANPKATVQVIYPYNYRDGDQTVRLRVQIVRDDFGMLLGGFWDRPSTSLEASSVSLLQILK